MKLKSLAPTMASVLLVLAGAAHAAWYHVDSRTGDDTRDGQGFDSDLNAPVGRLAQPLALVVLPSEAGLGWRLRWNPKTLAQPEAQGITVRHETSRH